MQENNTELVSNLDPEAAEQALKLVAEELARVEEIKKAELSRVLDPVAEEIEKKFTTRSARRGTKESQWLLGMRLYLGSLANNPFSLNPDKPFNREQTGHKPEYNIVRTKCNIAIAQSVSMQFGGGDKNFDLTASPDPKDPMGNPVDPALAEMAARAMENVVQDQLLNCEYGHQSRMAIQDRIILGTGIMKGPINALNHKKKYRKLMTSQGKMVTQAQLEKVKEPSVVRVNPWFFFPDDSVTCIEDAEDAIEAHPMSQSKLYSLAISEESGFYEFKDTILELCKTPPKEYAPSQTFTQFTNLTDPTNTYRGKYLVLEYHGPVSLEVLNQLSITPTYESPTGVYYGEIWACQGKVIRVELSYIDGCYKVPYATCPWEADPASVFGIGLPILVADQQLVINETYTMMLDNASASSGPQVIIDRLKVEPSAPMGGPSDYEIRPNKVWLYQDYGDKDARSAFEFFIVPNVTESLMNIINLARQLAEEESEVPLLQGGMQSPQVMNSATGAEIVRQTATVVLDYKNELWDDNITYNVINWMIDWNWENNDRPDILGDFEVDVKSSSDLRSKQIHIGNLEKLSVEASQNPALGQMVKMQNLTKARLSLMQLPTADIIKSDEQIQQEQQEAAKKPDPEMIKLEIEMKEAETKAKMAELKAMELEQNLTLQQQREAWEHEEKMSANYARVQESYAQVMAEETRRQTELIKLAQTEKTEAAWVYADLKKADMQDKREKFFKGLDHVATMREQMLQEEEIKLAKKNGGGALSTV